MLQQQALAWREEVAILAPGAAPLTYGALWEQTLHVVSTLQSQGVSKSTRVAVVLPNGPEMAVVFLGVAMCATCVPLNPGSRESEIRFYLGDIGAQVLILARGDNGPGRLVAAELGLTVLELEVAAPAAAGIFVLHPGPTTHAPSSFSEPDDVALILHTSGTTARPKIVPLTHTNLLTSANNIARHLALSPEDRCLNVMPLFHIHGLVGALLSPLVSGGSVVCTTGFHEQGFFESIAEFQPTWYTAVPAIHQSVLAGGERYRQAAPGHRFRFVRSSSASLPPATMKALEELLQAPVVEAYSMTEASHQMTSNALPPGLRRAGSVGVATGIEVAVMDNNGLLLSAGETGEIVVRGQSVIRAYENNPIANAASFTEGWFRTGDQGRFDGHGALCISGRIKEIVNRGGEKVSPREVDDVLLEHPNVEQAAAFGVPHPTMGEDLVAAVVLRPETTVSEFELRRFLFEKLSEFKVPSRVLFVDAIPKGPTGKVQRTSLHQVLGTALLAPSVAPTTDLEIGLAAAWSKVLGVARVGIHDNFFALGGDSLGVLKLCVEMKQAVGIEFQLEDVFRAPTIAELAMSTSTEVAQSASVVVPLQAEGDGIPVFCLYGINLYKSFAQALGASQPVFGVFVREEQVIVKEVAAGGTPTISIKKLVDAYDMAIARFRPHGPYRLAGFSFGGIIAMELAVTLRARGELVDHVMLLDTVLSYGQSRNWLKWISYQAARMLSGQTFKRVRTRLAKLRNGTKAHSGNHEVSEVEEIAAQQVAAFRRAARRWKLVRGVVDFPVVLYRARDQSRWAPYDEQSADYGWRKYLGGRLRIVDVPGVHLKILEMPNVAELGQKARDILLAGAVA